MRQRTEKIHIGRLRVGNQVAIFFRPKKSNHLTEQVQFGFVDQNIGYVVNEVCQLPGIGLDEAVQLLEL